MSTTKSSRTIQTKSSAAEPTKAELYLRTLVAQMPGTRFPLLHFERDVDLYRVCILDDHEATWWFKLPKSSVELRAYHRPHLIIMQSAPVDALLQTLSRFPLWLTPSEKRRIWAAFGAAASVKIGIPAPGRLESWPRYR